MVSLSGSYNLLLQPAICRTVINGNREERTMARSLISFKIKKGNGNSIDAKNCPLTLAIDMAFSNCTTAEREELLQTLPVIHKKLTEQEMQP